MIYLDKENRTAVKVEAVRYDSHGIEYGRPVTQPMVGFELEMFRLGADDSLTTSLGVVKLDRIQADDLMEILLSGSQMIITSSRGR